MKLEAYAKLNLTLEVFGRRPDGFHALRSLVVPITLSDTVEIVPSRVFSTDTGYGDNDLCLRAARAFDAASPISVRVLKRIPVGGGLGGGSADAAAVLAGLAAMFADRYSPSQLLALGATVGSDVPSLILARECGAVLMQGRGEIVSPFGINAPLNFVLANPGAPSSTAAVYAHCAPRPVSNDDGVLDRMRLALSSGELGRVSAAMMNDLTAPAISLEPRIGEALSALKAAGTIGAAMSGSGSTVFGLAPDEDVARTIVERLRARGLAAWPAKWLSR